MKLEIITEGKLENSKICRKINNILLNNQWVKEKTPRETKYLKQIKIETQHTKSHELQQQQSQGRN